MFRTADSLEEIPAGAVIVCASCQKGVYLVKDRNPRHIAKIPVVLLAHIDRAVSEYHLAWCAKCKCELQLNLRFLYITPVSIEDIMTDTITLGRRMMVFECDYEPGG